MTIAADTATLDSTVPGSDGGGVVTTVVIRCDWVDIAMTQPQVDGLNKVSVWVADVLAPINGLYDLIAIEYYERFGVLHKAGDNPGEWLKAQEADCSRATHPGGVVDGTWRWIISVPPDPADLIPGTTRRVTEIVQPPESAINPAGPGIVNLGMWLAVEPAGPYVARAQIPASGPAAVWAETRATMTSTTFEFGSGESVTCDGAGTPIPESAEDDIAEGPCGHTFTDFTGDTTVTITTRWAVTWELSDGRTGAEADIVMSTAIPYEVREIQTVGTGNR